MDKRIYTIGHSNHPITALIAMLLSFDIKVLADIRSMPGSKRNPQFNRAALERSLLEMGIKYIHIPELGGKQHIINNADNGEITGRLFAGYIAYMKTTRFKTGIDTLQKEALIAPVAYMCAEALWSNCHRSHVSDFLKSQGWEVLHITDVNKYIIHPDPSPAIVQGNLFL